MAALIRVDRQEFADRQQFRDRHFRLEQQAWDDRSGLKNTGELSKAYFAPGREYLCWRFTAFVKLTMPVLVISGRYDGAIPIGQMRGLAGELPHARFDEFTRSAHFPYAEEPDKFAHDVTRFLAEPFASFAARIRTPELGAGVH